ncbi:unnamed protein product [Caenorhabditis angaria]|uniref:DUF19 domain-containing protein n=1 Tax=Caenorhabditis angaria TaxID=860376 RepID=A0A9P1N634_9PELO|nr:unnamed protein product [Caenorhabditis angaria]
MLSIRSLAFCSIIATLATVIYSTCPNRAIVAKKAVKFGVTFYTAAELQPILTCIEPQLYKDPNDTTTLISTGKSCVINNSASKAISALSLYSSFNSCTDLMALLDKLTKPFLTICKVPINKSVAVLNACKANTTIAAASKQDACINKMYGTGLAIVTKDNVNKYCTQLAAKMTSTEWGCCKTYAPKVVNVKLYKCYNITK